MGPHMQWTALAERRVRLLRALLCPIAAPAEDLHLPLPAHSELQTQTGHEFPASPHTRTSTRQVGAAAASCPSCAARQAADSGLGCRAAGRAVPRSACILHVHREHQLKRCLTCPI